MSGHEHHLLGGEPVGHRHRLLRIARVVTDIQHQLLAEHAAMRVDVGHRQLGPFLQLLAEARIFAGHRAGRRDLDLGVRRCGRQCQGHSQTGGAREQGALEHENRPPDDWIPRFCVAGMHPKRNGSMVQRLVVLLMRRRRRRGLASARCPF
jgi:hypothetical protein